MSKLFEATSINGMNLSNRFVRSATWEGLATTDGAVTPRLIERMVELAKGGVGLIISSHTYVSKEGQGTPWQLGIYKDELIPGLKELTNAVHENGGKILLQLAHAGNYAEENLTKQPPLVVSKFEGLAETTILEGTADYISMSRPFIREPGLINRWKSGDRQKAKCISDNLCFNPGFEGKGVYCVTKEREKKRENGTSAGYQPQP